jgi:PAS domain S-box-containing protein
MPEAARAKLKQEKAALRQRIAELEQQLREQQGQAVGEKDEHYQALQEHSAQSKAEAEVAFQASLLDQVHNGVIAIDTNNIILYWNKYAEELYQWSREEALGKNIIDLLSPEELKATVYANFDHLNREGHWEGEFNVRRKDGSTIPVHITNSALKNDGGHNVGFVGISVDVTQARQAEAALRESKERFRSVVYAMSEGIVIQLASGKNMFCNPSAEAILGLSASQILGQTSTGPGWSAIQENGLPFPTEAQPGLRSLRTGKPYTNIVMGLQLPEQNPRWLSLN